MRNACKDAGGRILKNALLRGTISSSRENVKKTARDRVSNDYGPSRVGRTAVSAGRSPINLLCLMESEYLTYSLPIYFVFCCYGFQHPYYC